MEIIDIILDAVPPVPPPSRAPPIELVRRPSGVASKQELEMPAELHNGSIKPEGAFEDLGQSKDGLSRSLSATASGDLMSTSFRLGVLIVATLLIVAAGVFLIGGSITYFIRRIACRQSQV